MKKQNGTRLTPAKIQKLLDKTLAAMIDEWFDNVSGYYCTENSHESGAKEPELKRFHDEKGHRIKFAKETLQCTYGLRAFAEGGVNRIEISVNNKSEAFDYDEFLNRLDRHYRSEINQSDARSQGSRKIRTSEIFLLESDLRQAFSVERSEGKADVVRLSFLVQPKEISDIAANPGELKTYIEEYCLSPLRRIYAELYRRTVRG